MRWKHPRQNPDNADEYWCDCPHHKCYIHKSNFGIEKASSNGLATICKQRQHEYCAVHKNKRQNESVADFNESSAARLDRSKWPNFKKYLLNNPEYCKALLGDDYDEAKAKLVFEGK